MHARTRERRETATRDGRRVDDGCDDDGDDDDDDDDRGADGA